MAKTCFVFFVGAIFFAIFVVNEAQENPDGDELIHSSIDYDSFDLLITKRLASSRENFLISPLGAKLALCILSEASTGATQAELTTALGFDTDRTRLRRKYNTILSSLNEELSPQHIINLGNRIYIGPDVQPRERFKAIASTFYKTEIQKLDLSEPATASQQINTWVSIFTHGKITAAVNEDDVRNSVMLILSTLYFKGSWLRQFPPTATTVGVFYVSINKQPLVPFMNVVDNFYYTLSSKFGAQIIRMPYKGKKFAMYCIVPAAFDYLHRVFDNLSALRSELFNMEEGLVNLTLPMIKYNDVMGLSGVLKELGVTAAFDDTASLPGINRGSNRLKVSKVVQRSSLEVDEVGNVPYSSTGTSFGKVTVHINVNRPFFFFIQDEATRQLLFTAKVSNPLFVMPQI